MNNRTKFIKLIIIILTIAIFIFTVWMFIKYQYSQIPNQNQSSTTSTTSPIGGMLTSAQGPVDLIVTDPDGFTITPTTIIPSETEYLREIPGVLYYSEMEKGFDGNPIDRVYSYVAKTGDYIIQVIPTSDALPTSIYILEFSIGNRSITLAQNTPISQIPPQGYIIRVAPNGSIFQVSFKIYTNNKFGFQFEYPENWTMHENIFGGPTSKFNLTGASPKENGIPNPVISSFLVNIVTPIFTKNAFYDLNGTDITVAGVSGKKYELEFEGIKEIGIDIPFGQYHIIIGATKEYEDVFNQILASFKFLKSPQQ